MLKSHFSASQFIVVSLKEGMFNNANVIFRTKFVDGVSTVGRTVNRHAAPRGAAAEAEGGVGAREGPRKRGKTAARGSASSPGERENADD